MRRSFRLLYLRFLCAATEPAIECTHRLSTGLLRGLRCSVRLRHLRFLCAATDDLDCFHLSSPETSYAERVATRFCRRFVLVERRVMLLLLLL